MEKFSGDGTDVDFEALAKDWQEVQKKTKSFLNLLFNIILKPYNIEISCVMHEEDLVEKLLVNYVVNLNALSQVPVTEKNVPDKSFNL